MWDVFIITMLIAVAELNTVGEYLSEHMLSESCQQLKIKHNETCFKIDATARTQLWWFLAHVLT
jgi:hypothetical protein